MSGLVEHNGWFAHETAVIDEGCSIGAGTRIWHFSHIMRGATLGEGCNIGQNVVISPDVMLGRNCKVQNNVSLYTGVTCEDDVFLGPSCVFTNVTNPRSAVVRRDQYARTHVGRGRPSEPMRPLSAATTSAISPSSAPEPWSPRTSQPMPSSSATLPDKTAG